MNLYRYQTTNPAGTDTIEEGMYRQQNELPFVRGLFDNLGDAQEAWERLRALGVKPEEIEIKVTPIQGPAPQDTQLQPQAAIPPTSEITSVAFATGALGAVLGGLAGWMVSIRAIGIPGIGLVGDASVPASTVGGIILGAAVGTLAGAMLTSATKQTNPTDKSPAHTLPTILTAQSASVDPRTVEFVLSDCGATNIQTHHVYPADMADLADTPATHTGIRASNDFEQTLPPYPSEDYTMHEEPQNHGADVPTSTSGAIDPETGALGTADTPLTTGHEASGATVGTGTAQTKSKYDRGNFSGATPDSTEYDKGGRASADVGPSGDIQPLPPTERELQTPSHPQSEAIAHTESAGATEATDIYAQETALGPQPRPTMTADIPGIDTEPPQASEGTNIPGTSDPRGLGDNRG